MQKILKKIKDARKLLFLVFLGACLIIFFGWKLKFEIPFGFVKLIPSNESPLLITPDQIKITGGLGLLGLNVYQVKIFNNNPYPFYNISVNILKKENNGLGEIIFEQIDPRLQLVPCFSGSTERGEAVGLAISSASIDPYSTLDFQLRFPNLGSSTGIFELSVFGSPEQVPIGEIVSVDEYKLSIPFQTSYAMKITSVSPSCFQLVGLHVPIKQ